MLRSVSQIFARRRYGALGGRLTNFHSAGQVLREFQNSLHVLKNEVNIFDRW